jgi:hypothetical protein
LGRESRRTAPPQLQGLWVEVMSAQELDVRRRNLEQYEREIVSKFLPNWGKFAICHRNFRSQRKEYGK